MRTPWVTGAKKLASAHAYGKCQSQDPNQSCPSHQRITPASVPGILPHDSAKIGKSCSSLGCNFPCLCTGCSRKPLLLRAVSLLHEWTQDGLLHSTPGQRLSLLFLSCHRHRHSATCLELGKRPSLRLSPVPLTCTQAWGNRKACFISHPGVCCEPPGRLLAENSSQS